jgi:hypothetical protein
MCAFSLIVALGVIGCSGGARNARTDVAKATQQAASTGVVNRGANEPALTGRPKCPRRRVETTEDGRELIVYMEDTGSCDRPVGVTRFAAE